MTLTRRKMLLTTGAATLLTACMGGDEPEPGPGNVMASASMTAGANPGPDGSGRPLTVTLVQLRGTDGFNAADFVALQNPAATLAADLVRVDTLVLAPGGSAQGSFPVEVMAGATAIGVIAGFRDPSGRVFRTTLALPATGDLPLTISVAGSGLSVT